MRSPSARCFPNRCDLYRDARTQDADAGTVSTPTPTVSGVACSVQTDGDEFVYDQATGRQTQVSHYAILFPADPGLNPRDQAVWTDAIPAPVTLIVQGREDGAGRHAYCRYKAILNT